MLTTLESSSEWAERLRSLGLQNIVIAEDAGAVSEHLAHLLSIGQRFDIVVVDGVEPRDSYVETAAQLVAQDGVLVVDNSDRAAYRAALERLTDFKRLDFFGMGPQNAYAWGTSIFTRSGFVPRGSRDSFGSAVDY